MKSLIVDDHAVVRRGLADILYREFGVVDQAEADCSDSALRVARAVRPDLVLLDLHMPNSGPARELCSQLRSVLPDALIILLTAFERSSEIRDCLTAGASGCLLKDSAHEDLIASLQQSLNGVTVIDPRVAQSLARDLVGATSARGRSQLTAREREVLALLAEGCSNRRIAARLGISCATVKGHVSSVLEKFGVSSRLAAVVRATDEGLL